MRISHNLLYSDGGRLPITKVYNGPIIWRHYLLNIEQQNEVETDLVERYDVPLTNKVTPDVTNSINSNSLSLYSLNPCLHYQIHLI